MPVKKIELEDVGSGYTRFAVPGGWLLRSPEGDLVFIEDSTGQWLVSDTVPNQPEEPPVVVVPNEPPVVVVPAEPPVVEPPFPGRSSWLGTNLHFLEDYSPFWLFRNVFQQSRPWISGSWDRWDDGRALNLDNRGEVLALAQGQLARKVLFSGSRPTDVDYVLTWEGEGTFTVDSALTVSKGVGRMVLALNPTGNVVFNLISTTPDNPVRNFSLVRADQEQDTGLFNKDTVKELSQYRCLRFMDLQATNTARGISSLVRDFAARDQLPVTMSGAVPLRVLIQLANECKTDAWFCVNINAPDSYASEMLTIIKNELDPSLKAYVEFGNENWNSAFPNYQRLTGSNHDQKMQYAAEQAGKLGKMTKTALGDRGVSVLGAQAPATWWLENFLKLVIAAGYPVPDVVATAPYFGDGLADDLGIFQQQLDDSISQAVEVTRVGKEICSRYGTKLVCYEGGSHVRPGVVVNRDSRMYQAYQRYLKEIKETLGGELFCHYCWVSSYGSSGSWGERENQYGPEQPKGKAVKEQL